VTHLPKTPIQRRLDEDFESMFARALPPIEPPLPPEMMAEGDLAAELG